MRPSLWLLLGLGVVTLGLRIAHGDQPPRPDLEGFQDTLATELRADGFTTTALRVGTVRAVEGLRGDCTVSAAAEIFHGARLDAFAAYVPEGHQTRIYYGGYQQEFPRIEPLVSQYAHRYLTSFGFDSSFTPVILVASDADCDLSNIDFAAMRMHFTS